VRRKKAMLHDLKDYEAEVRSYNERVDREDKTYARFGLVLLFLGFILLVARTITFFGYGM